MGYFSREGGRRAAAQHAAASQQASGPALASLARAKIYLAISKRMKTEETAGASFSQSSDWQSQLAASAAAGSLQIPWPRMTPATSGLHKVPTCACGLLGMMQAGGKAADGASRLQVLQDALAHSPSGLLIPEDAQLQKASAEILEQISTVARPLTSPAHKHIAAGHC